MKAFFTIPGRLPGINEIVNVARTNRFAGAKQKKEETERCAMWALRLPTFKAPVGLRIRWVEPNMRRDVDNISGGVKFILDGLVHSGKLPGDSRKWVKTISHEFLESDAQNPRIEVYIETIEEEAAL